MRLNLWFFRSDQRIAGYEWGDLSTGKGVVPAEEFVNHGQGLQLCHLLGRGSGILHTFAIYKLQC